VRKRFGIKSGCELGWYEEGGRLLVDLARPNTLADARKALQGKSSPKSLKEIREGIKGQVGEKFKRPSR